MAVTDAIDENACNAVREIPSRGAVVVATLSANHLAALRLPLMLRRLNITCDADAAGAALTKRANAAGIEALALSSGSDFNEDLR